ncbi:MAG: peroxidase-related enzyme [Terracidiphilus sp.]
MPHINLPKDLPGISSGFAFRPETARPMRELAHILLHEPNSLTQGERELIATYVSTCNDCHFCQASHGAAAACHLGGSETVRQVKSDFTQAPISAKMKALLAIAGKVQQGGKQVTTQDVEAARVQGATDIEIHDTVLIAAAFCMYNRYVDGLGTWQPEDESMYAQMGRHLAAEGYRTPSIKRASDQAAARS